MCGSDHIERKPVTGLRARVESQDVQIYLDMMKVSWQVVNVCQALVHYLYLSVVKQ